MNENEPVRVEVGNNYLMITKVGEIVFVTDATCTHEEADLSLGILSGTVITCPLHQAKFDLNNGLVLQGPNRTDPSTIPELKTYKVKIENDEILIDI